MNVYDFINFGFLSSARDLAGGALSNYISDSMSAGKSEEEGGIKGTIGRRARNRELAEEKMRAGKSRKSMGKSIDTLGDVLKKTKVGSKLGDTLKTLGGHLQDRGEDIMDDAVDIYDRNTSKPMRWLHKAQGKEMTYGDKKRQNKRLSKMKKGILEEYRNKQVDNKATEFKRMLTARDARNVYRSALRSEDEGRRARNRMLLDKASSLALRPLRAFL